MIIVIPYDSRHGVVYNAFIMKTESEPKTEVFLQNLLKPTDRKHFETVTTLVKISLKWLTPAAHIPLR